VEDMVETNLKPSIIEECEKIIKESGCGFLRVHGRREAWIFRLSDSGIKMLGLFNPAFLVRVPGVLAPYRDKYGRLPPVRIKIEPKYYGPKTKRRWKKPSVMRIQLLHGHVYPYVYLLYKGKRIPPSGWRLAIKIYKNGYVSADKILYCIDLLIRIVVYKMEEVRDSKYFLYEEKRMLMQKLGFMLRTLLRERADHIRKTLKHNVFFEKGKKKIERFVDAMNMKNLMFMPHEVAETAFIYKKYPTEKNLAALEEAIEKAVNDEYLGCYFAAVKHSLRAPKRLKKMLEAMKPRLKRQTPIALVELKGRKLIQTAVGVASEGSQTR